MTGLTEKGINATLAAFAVPSHLRGGIERWVMLGVEPGSFLTAVLSNDLMRAVRAADRNSWEALPALIGWLTAEAPPECWGSPSRMEYWATSAGLSGLSDEQRKLMGGM
jgi:hypothetical protein